MDGADDRDGRYAPSALDEGALAAVCDELPLWSAPFGLRLLDAVALRPGMVALDVGCGTGFAALELAQRLGPAGQVHAVDPWHAGLERARARAAAHGVENLALHEARAERLPLPDASVDLIVSNNGLNNVADVAAALAECARVARPGAQLVYAYNLPGSLAEFYAVYDAVLAEDGREEARRALAAHIDHKRKPVAWTVAALERAGFAVERVVEDTFRLRFADAAAFFGHSLVRVAFLRPWLEVLEPQGRGPVFADIGRRLDAHARTAGELTMTIPLACVEARRRGA
jgi:SAM-dependent methyltransferase